MVVVVVVVVVDDVDAVVAGVGIGVVVVGVGGTFHLDPTLPKAPHHPAIAILRDRSSPQTAKQERCNICSKFYVNMKETYLSPKC